MWDLPRPGLEPVSPALAGRFSTTAPPGKPRHGGFVQHYTPRAAWSGAEHVILVRMCLLNQQMNWEQDAADSAGNLPGPSSSISKFEITSSVPTSQVWENKTKILTQMCMQQAAKPHKNNIKCTLRKCKYVDLFLHIPRLKGESKCETPWISSTSDCRVFSKSTFFIKQLWFHH